MEKEKGYVIVDVETGMRMMTNSKMLFYQEDFTGNPKVIDVDGTKYKRIGCFANIVVDEAVQDVGKPECLCSFDVFIKQ